VEAKVYEGSIISSSGCKLSNNAAISKAVLPEVVNNALGV